MSRNRSNGSNKTAVKHPVAQVSFKEQKVSPNHYSSTYNEPHQLKEENQSQISLLTPSNRSFELCNKAEGILFHTISNYRDSVENRRLSRNYSGIRPSDNVCTYSSENFEKRLSGPGSILQV